MPFRRIEASRFGTFLYDPEEDHYEFDMDAMEVLGGIARPDSKYRDMLARMPSQVRRAYEAWRQEAATGAAGRIRVPFELPDRTMILEIQIQPVAGKLRGLVADVTQDEQHWRAREAQLEVMELAARLVRFGVWVYDVKHDSFKASRHAVDLLMPGADPSRFSLEDVLQRIDAPDEQAVRAAHRQALETGQVQRVEFRREGRWFMVHFVRILDEAGDATKTCGMIHETTMLHVHEAATDELRGLEEVRARLVNAAAHELSQPITPMRLQLETLRDLVPDDPAVVQGFEVMERNLEHITLMVNGLLDAARSQAGSLGVEIVPTDAAGAVTHIVRTMQPLASKRNVKIEWTPPSAPHVYADPDRLQQCISNVLHNAIKFTREGSTVRIRADPQDHAFVLQVQDEGPGLDEQQAKLVFEPFQQIHQAPPGFIGTGLGLYVTRALMHAMSGTVEVDSRPGQGATFMLQLPTA